MFQSLKLFRNAGLDGTGMGLVPHEKALGKYVHPSVKSGFYEMILD